MRQPERLGPEEDPPIPLDRSTLRYAFLAHHTDRDNISVYPEVEYFELYP